MKMYIFLIATQHNNFLELPFSLSLSTVPVPAHPRSGREHSKAKIKKAQTPLNKMNSPQKRTALGTTPTIMESILVQDEKAVMDVLKQINFQDPLKGSTPLMMAIEFNNSIEVIKALLDCGARISVKDFIGNSPLHFAAIEGRADVARLLLERGADPNCANMDGKLPKDVVPEASASAMKGVFS